MTGPGELLALRCRPDDTQVIRLAAGPRGSALHVFDSQADFTQYALSHRLLAVFLGVGEESLANLDVIPVLRAVRADLPVIVIADQDSLELERSARRKRIFYYLVHPVAGAEVKAVLRDARRFARV